MLGFESISKTQILAGVVIVFVAYSIGFKFGRDSVTNADRLAAQNEVQHEIVRVTRVPTAEVFTQAEDSCTTARYREDCINDYIGMFSDYYQVNLVTGTRAKVND